MKDYICSCCKFDLAEDICYFSWHGQPFSVNSTVKLCSHCGFLLKPQVTKDNCAIIGTYANDIYSVKEMNEDGFNDKKRIINSIKLMGKKLNFTQKDIDKRVKG